MEMTKEPYKAEFPAGSRVRISESVRLKEFLRDWKYHHPLQPAQLQFAGHLATVANTYFYHGGDVLYELANVPGMWHECCLSAAETVEGRDQA